jgi:class 3 adenylate cyclase
MRASQFAISAVALAAAGLLNAGFNPETGDYVFQHYSAKQYGASPQNWAVAEDRRGVMYFANTEGLLEFDGSSWRKLTLPGGSTVRAVSVDDKGTIYVGGSGDFGRLAPDHSGTMQFVSLKNNVPQGDRAFGDIWRILPTRNGVYFSSYTRLLRLNPDGTIKVWRPQKRFARAFYVLNAVYVTSSGIGLMELGKDDRLVPAPGGDKFANEPVQAAIPYGKEALIATSLHLYHFSSGGAELFPTAADSHFAINKAYSMHTFRDGEIAVGTRTGGLVLVNPQGGVDRIFSTANGLLDDFVSAIYADPQAGVWLSSNNGITRVDPALTAFGKTEGLPGDVQVTARHHGVIYAGTSAGLFRLNASAGVEPQFERVEGLNSTEMWALKSYGNDLLAATNLGVFAVSGNHASKIFESTRTVFDLDIPHRDPNTMYIARLTAVTVLNRNGSTWTRAAEFEAAGEEFRSVVEDADGRVWATTKGNIWRFDFREQPVKSEKFGLAQGIPAGWVNARRLNGHVVFATTKGLLRYDGASKAFVPDTSLGKQFSDGSRDVEDIFDDASGNVWVTGEGYHGVVRRENGQYKWYSMPLLHSGISEIYSMTLDPDGVAWATGADSVLHRWERAVGGNPDRDFRVLTRRVQIVGQKGNWYGGAGAAPEKKLPWKENALRIEFAAPYYEEPSAVEYQVRLQGSDKEWSAWSHETTKDYTHLPEGSYRFEVRARTPHGAIAQDASIGFGILPPWYRTWWAYTLYAIFGGFGVWGIVRWKTSQLEEDKRKLEVIVEERTVEVRQQRDEIQVQEQKSQALLLNILPAKVADELKTTGAVQPVAFEDVTVCFTDFVGFTVSSEKMAPGTLVDALNEYFTRFDEIIARYQLEKLKTIGDSYMFVSGLPAKREAHAVDAVMAALEMVEVVKELGARAGGTGWNIRVGLHSGPVVAGVVGIRKFAFDIWGNTVNFAARMESSGVPGRVNMSERTCRQLRGLIDCESRGQVKIKEGRELPMFLAAGVARELVYGEVVNGAPDAFAARYREEFGEEPRSFGGVKAASQAMAAVARRA